MFVANVDIKIQISKYIYLFARNEEARNLMSIRILFDSNKFICPPEHVQCVSSVGYVVQDFYLTQIKFQCHRLM